MSHLTPCESRASLPPLHLRDLHSVSFNTIHFPVSVTPEAANYMAIFVCARRCDEKALLNIEGTNAKAYSIAYYCGDDAHEAISGNGVGQYPK